MLLFLCFLFFTIGVKTAFKRPEVIPAVQFVNAEKLLLEFDILDDIKKNARKELWECEDELVLLWEEMSVYMREMKEYKKLIERLNPNPLSAEAYKWVEDHYAVSQFSYIITQKQFCEKQKEGKCASLQYNKAFLKEYEILKINNFNIDEELQDEFEEISIYMHNSAINDLSVQLMDK